MAKGLLARKLGMTQLFTEQGTIVPVTVLEAGGQVVQLKTPAKDGYSAVQMGYGERKTQHTNKPTAGHFKRAGIKPLRTLVELRNAGEPELGHQFGVDVFQIGDTVDVVGTSKGKGTAGTVKRHHFGRGPVSHGSMNIRQPGSIGSVDAARVFPGVRMAGRLGGGRTTVRGSEVIRVDSERQLVLLKGAVPGPRNGIVLIRHRDKQAVLP